MTIIQGNSTTNYFSLSFTQCKQIQENSASGLRDFIEQLNNQPEWLKSMGAIDSLDEIRSILQGGCVSGAYMPAVTYYTARETIHKYADDILDFIDYQGHEVPQLDTNSGWGGFCVKICSLAVEAWCLQFEEVLENVEWD